MVKEKQANKHVVYFTMGVYVSPSGGDRRAT